MKQKIFVTREIPKAGLDLLKGYDLQVFPKDRKIKRSELLAGVKGASAILSILTEKIDGQVLDSAGSQLRIVANYAVGYNNIDLEAAEKKGVIVTNTPGVLTDTVAEHAVALIMSIARRIPESDRFTRAGKYKSWGPMLLLGSDLKGKTLGILGLGRIGQRVAEIASKGLGMNIIYYDKFIREHKYTYASLNSIFLKSDFITVHVPLLPETKHLVSAKALRIMKPSAYLINTSRGPVVDEVALVKALKKKQIKGAALDVYEHEPKLSPGLKSLDNVIITPHTASASLETREKMAIIAANNIIAVLEGRIPPNRVMPK
jgi:glyoxylate reductase